MEKWQITITIISALISGVLATIYSNWYYKKQNLLKIKRELLNDIFGYRYQLSASYNGDKSKINNALNRISIVYANNKKITKLNQELYQLILANANNKAQLVEDKLVSLIKALCDDAGIKTTNWNDSYVKNIYLIL